MKALPKINPNQPITIDLETCDPELKVTGPGYITGVGFVAGIAIAADEGSWYIPIRHAEGENYDEKEVIEWLNEICSADTDKVMHNAQYDLGWLSYIGVQLHGRIFDTMLAAPLLDENRFSYELDSLGKSYCNEGKFEEALKMAVVEKFNNIKTHKTIIRLKENVPKKVQEYPAFIDAKKRTTQLYDLWPKDIQDKYDVFGFETDKRGHELFKVPTTRQADIKGLLWAIDPEEMGTYPIQDVDLTRKLYFIFKEQLKAEKLEVVSNLEFELLPSLLEMRIQGVRIDMETAVDLDKQYTDKLNQLQKSLDQKCGFPVDVNITDDLIKVCNKFNLKYKITDKGNPCFNAESVPKDEFGIFETVLLIRNYYKARDTYIRGYVFGGTYNGWLHGQYNQLKSDDGGTVTGRLSSSMPNMQNLPNPKSSQIGKDIRGLFLPDNEDELWLSMDYSGQEPKMMIHTVIAMDRWKRTMVAKNSDPDKEYFPGAKLAMDPKFSGRGADFHTAVATICMEIEFGLANKVPTEDELKAAAKEFRPKAKSIGLGVMYGSGDQKVADEMTKKGYPMTKDEAHEIRQNIYQGVPFLDALNKEVMRRAQHRGYIKTVLGRRGHFDLWECPCWDKEEKEKIGKDNLNFKSRQDAFAWYNENRDKYSTLKPPQRAYTYKALNKYIQGSSADQTKTAMLHLYKRNDLSLNTLDIFYRRIPNFAPPKFKTQVHDEINVSITKGEKAEWYQDVMEHCLPLLVEVVADPVVCTKWSEAK
jgi:DNA polymerase I-like protein with 3'-5' exonuclease and polymerase domains